MNFQKIAPVEGAKEYLDLAFKKARLKAAQKNLKGTTEQRVKTRESMKIDIIKDDISARLKKILDDFPSFERLSDFYFHLAKLTLDYDNLKKSLAAVNWAKKQVLNLQKQYARSVVKAPTTAKAKEYSKQFYGRLSSIVKQIDPQLKFLDNARRTMKTYPDVKDMFTVCLYGFPNVGKTTMLNTMTGSTAKTAAYSFTTKSINCAYFTFRRKKIQMLDVPGTLARKDKMNLIELQAELTLETVADVIIYIFDFTETYPLKDQLKLYRKVAKKLPVLVYISKEDILTKEQQGLKEKFLLQHEIENFDLRNLRREIGKRYVKPPEEDTKV